MYLRRVKQFILLLTLFAMACQVPGDKVNTQNLENNDTLALYLTYDISINSCLLAWESIEKHTLSEAKSGQLDLYRSAFADLIPGEERERAFSYIAHDVTNDSEQLVAMESVIFQSVEGGFRLHQVSPFDGNMLVCGYVKSDDLLKILGDKEQGYLHALIHFNQLPSPGKDYAPSAMYTASMLLIDTAQKYLAFQVEKKARYALVNEQLQAMSDSMMRERVLQYVDSLAGTQIISTKKRVSEYDLWKGFMAYGLLGPKSLSWNSFGLLYHPNSKFGGFNPGKILWFAVPNSELTDKDPILANFIAMLAKYGILHSVDPSTYRCNYYRMSSIDIDNGRYPRGRH